MAKMKWTIEVEVDESWVADGFDVTDDRALDWLTRDLAYAYEGELGAKVIARPEDEDIARVQGYSSAEAWRRNSPAARAERRKAIRGS